MEIFEGCWDEESRLFGGKGCFSGKGKKYMLPGAEGIFFFFRIGSDDTDLPKTEFQVKKGESLWRKLNAT